MKMNGFCVLVCLLIRLNLLFVSITGAVSILFNMPEEQNAGYVFGNVLEKYASDRNDLILTLMRQGNAPEPLFHVNEISGNLSTLQKFDREKMCEFTITCEISLEIAVQTTHNDGYFDVIRIVVHIDDVNDNAPIFTKAKVDLDISEAVLLGATFTIDGARDGDTSAQFSLKSYELQPFVPGERLPFSIAFSINLDGSSTIKLTVNQKLDREVHDTYTFNVVAKDGGVPPLNGTLLVNVTVSDVNDNNPQFNQSSYNVTVREDVQVNATILTLVAFDRDIGNNREIRYRLSSFQPIVNLKYFFVNEVSGELKVKETLNLITDTNFNIIVEAIDLGDASLTNQTFVYITVLDTSNSAPEIRLNLLSAAAFCRISEYANVGAVVAYMAVVDRDTGRNGDVNCSILSEAFGLQKYAILEYKVIVTTSLDREQVDTHNVTVYCDDRGVPPMSSSNRFLVNIDDENDNPPRFTQQRYFANINENNEIGDIIATVSAFDLDIGNNSKLSYSIETAFSKYVFVNSDTGGVMANKVFDKESVDGHGLSFTVYATDNGSPPLTGTASVIVTINDVNDNKPIFKQDFFRFWVEENLPADTLVGTLLSEDKDTGINAVTKYAFKNDSKNIPFVVFENGVIKTNRELDREARTQYIFTVIATDAADEQLYSTATVAVFVVDLNDNSPQITYPMLGNNTVYVPYLTPENSVIFSVLALDFDEPQSSNSKLLYSLTILNTTNIFAINSLTGDITLTAPLANTNYLNKMFSLIIDVRDGGVERLAATASLNVMIVADDKTLASLTDEFSRNESRKNFVIVIVVATVTILISVGIIVTICIIRRIDTRRQQSKAIQEVLSKSMYCKNNDEMDDIFPQLPMDNSFSGRKKKEVNFQQEEKGTVDINPTELYQHNDNSHESCSHMLLEPPPEYQLRGPCVRLDDCRSDMSGESNGDSGKGGSDDDLHSTSIGCRKEDNHRPTERRECRRSKSPAAIQQLQTFPIRFQPSRTLSPQKIVPFPFRKDQSYVGNRQNLNHLSVTATPYGVPVYYDEEGQSPIGFHTADSNSTLNIHNQTNVQKINLNQEYVPDCVV